MTEGRIAFIRGKETYRKVFEDYLDNLFGSRPWIIKQGLTKKVSLSEYQHTAKFLMWLDTQFHGFTDKTNKTPEQLWAAYRESRFKQEQLSGLK